MQSLKGLLNRNATDRVEKTVCRSSGTEKSGEIQEHNLQYNLYAQMEIVVHLILVQKNCFLVIKFDDQGRFT